VLTMLAGMPVAIKEEETYQLTSAESGLLSGISPHDLFSIEKVTYSPETCCNTVLARHSLSMDGGDRLLMSTVSPWHSFFVRESGIVEYKFAATVREALEKESAPGCYGAALALGGGRLIFTQIVPRRESAKARRVYSRILANLGAAFDADLLGFVKTDQDYAIPYFMGLPHEEYQDYGRMEAYFCAPDFVLNNLGEGVYGWMKYLAAIRGVVTAPKSAGRTYFLTVFVRWDGSGAAGHNLLLGANCACRVFLNGRLCLVTSAPASWRDCRVTGLGLHPGLNRLLIVCRAGQEDARLSACFKDPAGTYPRGLKYLLTLD